MTSYHQMGHNSENLVPDGRLGSFSGVILSPVNRLFEELRSDIAMYRELNKRLVFDPQLYYPNSDKGQLPTWPYFPSENVDSEDLTNISWWSQPIAAIVGCLEGFGKPEQLEVASPAQVPRVASVPYYTHVLQVAINLQSATKATVIPTIIVDSNHIANNANVMELASMLSGTKFKKFYIVFRVDVDPRNEVADLNYLKGCCKLINLLKNNKKQTLISHCSTDVILWKAAGATDCATGKFFNLRRFTPSRYDPPKKGGGQVAYWIEEKLLAFIREPDFIAYDPEGYVSRDGVYGEFYPKIKDAIASGEAWVGDSWRLYMAWFASVEGRISGKLQAIELFDSARNNWSILSKAGLHAAEPVNDGSWLMPWKNALGNIAG